MLDEEEVEEDVGTPVCIFNVPKSLMIMDPDFYTPQEVAIDPYHHWPQELYEMERYKIAAAKTAQEQLQNAVATSPSPMATKTASSSRLCLCAPTTHPGSFRCSLHRRPSKASDKTMQPPGSQSKAGTTDHLVKAFLMQIVKPSSHDLQRRRDFQPKPSRFCNVVASDHRLAGEVKLEAQPAEVLLDENREKKAASFSKFLVVGFIAPPTMFDDTPSSFSHPPHLHSPPPNAGQPQINPFPMQQNDPSTHQTRPTHRRPRRLRFNVSTRFSLLELDDFGVCPEWIFAPSKRSFRCFSWEECENLDDFAGGVCETWTYT
ncbi:unnamed protein product [Citrullus colocynthis]|uniref:Uncharacterized protein n=1 Tax=Citrullus colocynthis TaxID=252529 RepID=A0ABP0XQY3_9ROSI